MINAMLPEQVARFWDVIKYGIEQSLPPISGEHPDKMNRVLSSLMSGRLICWAAYYIDGEQRVFEGIMVTTITYDMVSDTKSLLIYCLFGYGQVTDQTWLDGLRALTKYGKSKGCTTVSAYTDLDHMVKMTKALGGSSDWHYCTFDVDNLIDTLK